tara:strand:- start:235 stop:480 length:246 start_codon:yes stop_codon:yes gene_type:complete
MKDQMIEVLRQHAVSNLNLHKTNIDAYLSNPAGIGEHSDIMETIQAELDKMAIHQDRLAMLNAWRALPEQEIQEDEEADSE